MSDQSKSIIGERIELCKSCEHLNKLNFCKHCGCFMPGKVRLRGAECPIGKWKKFTELKE